MTELSKAEHDLKYFRRRPKSETIEQTLQRKEDLQEKISVLKYQVEDIDNARLTVLESLFSIEEALDTIGADTKPTTILDPQAPKHEPVVTTDPASNPQTEKPKDTVSAPFYEHLKKFTDKRQEIIEGTRIAILNGDEQFSLGLLADGPFPFFTEEESNQIMTLMHPVLQRDGMELEELQQKEQEASDTIEAIAEDVETVDVSDEAEQVTSETETQLVEFEMENDGIEIIVRPLPAAILEDSDKEVIGEKQESPYDSIAITTVAHTIEQEGFDLVHRGSRELNPTMNTDLLNGSKLQAGTPLRIAIDVDFVGNVNTYSETGVDKTTTIEVGKYYMENGKVKMDTESIANIPIKIMDEAGKTVGWVHRNKWIAAAVDSKSEERHFNVQGVGNNAEIQQLLNLEQRTKIIQAFNAGISEVSGAIVSKDSGRLLKNRTMKKASNHVKGLELGVVVNSKLLGTTQPITTELTEGWNNRMVAIVPRADGTHTAYPMQSLTLMEKGDGESEAHAQISRVTELYAYGVLPKRSVDEKIEAEIETIKTHTGFDVSTKDGYRNYIIQYFTHFNSLSQYLDKTNKTKSILHTDDVSKLPGICIGNPSGNPDIVLATVNEHGELSEDFKQALATLLTMRYKTVNISDAKKGIKGLNSKEAFNYMKYKDGKWSTKSIVTDVEKGITSPYNHYSLTFAETNLTHGLINGETKPMEMKGKFGQTTSAYIYDVNPIIKFQIDDSVIPAISNSEPHMSLVDPENETTPTESISTLESLWESGDLDFSPMETLGTTKIPATISNLTKLANSIPIKERSDLSPAQVQNYLLQEGITHLAKGYNPFKKC